MLHEKFLNEAEAERITDLLRHVPPEVNSVLDVGTRDGHVSTLMADRNLAVTALDLEMPPIKDNRIRCVKGDATELDFPDGAFDLVVCAEVLEHIRSSRLGRACNELARVASRYVLIGVPYRQDLRDGRTNCQACRKTNPPWGHVNAFDESRLQRLMPSLSTASTSFVGVGNLPTNELSRLLLDMAGNPYGTYHQQEPCIHCGAPLQAPVALSISKKLLVKAAFCIRALQRPFCKPRPRWLHVLFEKQSH